MERRIALEGTFDPEGVKRGAREGADALRQMGADAVAGADTATKGFNLADASLLQLNKRSKDTAVAIADLREKMLSTQKSGGVVSESDIRKLTELEQHLGVVKKRQIEVGEAYESTGSKSRNLANDYGSVEAAMTKMELKGTGLTKAVGTLGNAVISATAVGGAWGAALAGVTAEMARQIDKSSTHEAALSRSRVEHQKTEAALRLAERGAIAYDSSLEKMVASMERLVPNSARLRAELETLGEIRPPEVFAKYEADSKTWAQSLQNQLKLGKQAWLDYAEANEPALRAIEKAATLHKDALDPAIRAALQALDSETNKTRMQTEAMEALNKKYERAAELRKMQGEGVVFNADTGAREGTDAEIKQQEELRKGRDAVAAADVARVQQFIAQEQAARNANIVINTVGQSINNVGKEIDKLIEPGQMVTTTLLEWRFPEGDHMAKQVQELTASEWKLWEAVVKTADAFGPSLLSKNMEAFAKLFRERTIDAAQFREELNKLFVDPQMLENSKATGAEIQKLMQLFFDLKGPIKGLGQTLKTDLFDIMADRRPFDAIHAGFQSIGDDAERMAGRVTEAGVTASQAFANMAGSISKSADQVEKDAGRITGAAAGMGGSLGTAAGPTRNTLNNLTYQLGRVA